MQKHNFTGSSNFLQDSGKMGRGGKGSKSYFLKLAKTRKTTYEFTNKSVTENNLKSILEAGRWAPSCTNTQPWHFIIVKNKLRIKQLMMTTNFGDFHTSPSLIIALVLSTDKCPGVGFACFRGLDSGVYDSFMSVGMAGLNMVLEAWDQNINSCILSPTPKKVKELLKIKRKDYVPLLLGFGYQSQNAFQKRRVRNSIKSITSYEYFGGRK